MSSASICPRVPVLAGSVRGSYGYVFALVLTVLSAPLPYQCSKGGRKLHLPNNWLPRPNGLAYMAEQP